MGKLLPDIGTGIIVVEIKQVGDKVPILCLSHLLEQTLLLEN